MFISFHKQADGGGFCKSPKLKIVLTQKMANSKTLTHESTGWSGDVQDTWQERISQSTDGQSSHRMASLE